MVDVKRTAAKIEEKEIRSYLDKMESEMINSLRHGNIYEVFAKSKFKISDFQDFFSNQWKAYKGEVIQDEDIKAMYASFAEPNINQFAVHNKGMSMSQEHKQMFSEGMQKSLEHAVATGKFKSMAVKKVKEAKDAEQPGNEDPNKPMDIAELQDMTRGTLGEWDEFLGDVWMQIMDAQMMSDYQTRMAEIKGEVDRLIALAKQGAIGPEFVLIALAKVNCMKNGVLITWLGKKAFHINDSINNVANDLHKVDPGSSGYYGEMQMAQEKTRDGSFQLNLVMQDMQKAMQDIASTLENVQSIIGEINRTRREIVSRVGANR